MSREIKKKNVFVVYALMFLTLGIYGIVWTVKSKRDMNALGAQIPSSWLIIIPVANIYWTYKYCEGFSKAIKKDDKTMLWFVVSLFVGFIMPAIIQSGLNEKAEASQLKSNDHESSKISKAA